MASETWLKSIAEIRHAGTRGTAFVISEHLALTACHVLEALVNSSIKPSSETVNLYFADLSTEPCRAIAWDVKADWLLLERLAPVTRPVLRLMALSQGQPLWRSVGFPEAKRDGLRVGGQVTAWQAAWGGVNVIQLLCTEALAGNLKVQGLSGAPCVVGGGVVGLLRKSLLEEYTYFNVGGTLFACSTEAVLRGLEARGIAAPQPLLPAMLVRLCRLQCERTLSTLEHGSPFQPQLHTQREPVESFLRALAGGATPVGGKVCFIVGGSGVGKTNMLASVAQQAPADSCVLFIRVRLLGAGSQSLGNEVMQELTTSATQEGAPAGFDVTEVWQDRQAPKLILLDALNELPAAIDAEAWMERSMRWLQASPATTLIISCRPEYWERYADLVPEVWRFAMPSPEPERLSGPAGQEKLTVLGDFNADEADDALRRAFGSQRPIDPQDVMHPLLLRVYRELNLSAKSTTPPPSKAQALGELIRRKLNAAALKFQTVKPISLRLALGELACRIALGERESSDPLRNHELLSALCHTGLVEERNDSLVFVHDEVLEYLAASAIRLANFDAASLAKLKAELDPHRIGALKFALISAVLEDPGDTQARKVVETLLIESKWALDVVADVLVSLPDATSFIDQVRRYVKLRTFNFSTSDERHVLSQVRLCTHLKLRLLLEFREGIDAYDFESHHWKDIERNVLRSGPMDWVRNVIKADPILAFDELERWLGDSRPLSDSKANVSNLATGLLYHFADLDFERVCLAIIRAGSSGLTVLLNAHPEATAKLALRWLDGESGATLCMALPLCHWLAERQRTTPELRAACHLAIDQMPTEAGKYRSLRQILLKAEPEGRRFNNELLTEIKSTPNDNLDERVSLTHLLRTDFESTLAKLQRLRRFSVARMSVLGEFIGEPEQRPILVELLRTIFDQRIANDFCIAHAIEMQLRRMSADSIQSSGLFDLAREVLLGKNESMSATVFYAVLAGLQNVKLHWPQRLVYEVINLTPNGRTAEMLINHIAQLTPFWSAISPRLSAMCDAMGEKSFARNLLRIGNKTAAVADQLIYWVRKHPELLQNGLLQRFNSLVKAGIAPAEAAGQVLWDI